MALWWSRPDATGLQNLHVVYGYKGFAVVDRLLDWKLCEGGQPLSLKLRDRVYRPDRVVETGIADGVELQATVSYVCRNALAVEVEVTNTGEAVRSFTLEFVGPTDSPTAEWKGAFPGTNPGDERDYRTAVVPIEAEDVGSWSTFVMHLEHGRNMPWVKDYVAGRARDTHEFICLADMTPVSLELPAGGRRGVLKRMAFGSSRAKAKAASREAEAVLSGVEAAPSLLAERRIRALLERAPEPSPAYASPQWLRHYAHAITSLQSLFVRGEGGYTDFLSVPWTLRGGEVAMSFFWDTAFSCIALSRINPRLCREAIEAYCMNASPRGGLPGTLCDTHRAGEGQAPIMAWAALETFRAEPDLEWLRRIWPGLFGYHRFWKRHHAEANGLYLWYNAGQIADNDVRFDRAQGRGLFNEALDGFWSPDLQALMMLELKCLVRLAESLGRSDEAQVCRLEAETLGRLTVDWMWSQEDGRFRDVIRGTREPYSDALSPNYFFPFWVGVPLPREAVERSIRTHLLNPETFFNHRPFPSCARNHREYDPDGYWRGRVWPHISYLMVLTLARNGFVEEAAEAGRRILTLLTESPWMSENFHGDGTATPGKDNGKPDYNWALATAIQLITEAWRRPEPWEPISGGR